MFLDFFPKPIYSTMVAEKFQSCGEIKITGKYICESKNWIWSFLLMPPSKTLLQVFIITTQAEGNYSFLPNKVFWRSIFYPAEREVWIMELKKLSKLKLRGYRSQVLINSTIFTTFTFLVSVFLCHNIASNILKCEGSLT